MKNNKGFTLIELLIIVIVLGTLITIAMPQYFTAVEKSKIAEAYATLRGINYAEQVFTMGAENVTTFSTSFATLVMYAPHECKVQEKNDDVEANIMLCPYFTYILTNDGDPANTVATAYRNAINKQSEPQTTEAPPGVRGYSISLILINGQRCYSESQEGTTMAPSLGIPTCSSLQ